ncbi:MAG: ATP-binding protein [bacterium]
MALGGHHLLLAGSSGSGKSTWAENLICYLDYLNDQEIQSLYLKRRI